MNWPDTPDIPQSFQRISGPGVSDSRQAPASSYQDILIRRCENNSLFRKIFLDCNHYYGVSICFFDEDLFKHINRVLADYVGRESDTS